MFFSKLKTKEKFFADGLVEFQNNGLLAKIRGKIPSIVGNHSLFSEGDILLIPSANIGSKPRKKILEMPNDLLYIDKITRNDYFV